MARTTNCTACKTKLSRLKERKKWVAAAPEPVASIPPVAVAAVHIDLTLVVPLVEVDEIV